MTWRANDHKVSGRDALAAWIVCVGIVLTGIGVAAVRHQAIFAKAVAVTHSTTRLCEPVYQTDPSAAYEVCRTL
jgi:hypothetical protein